MREVNSFEGVLDAAGGLTWGQERRNVPRPTIRKREPWWWSSLRGAVVTL